MLDSEQAARSWLIRLLDGREAYMPFDEAIKGLPVSARGIIPEGMPHSIWQLVRHMQWAKHDILAYAQDSFVESPPWPSGYWPENPEPTESEWREALAAIDEDQSTLKYLINNSEESIFTPFENGSEHTLFRQAMLVAEHQAYHTGQVIQLRRLLGHWPVP
jgi:uncharacterized damage-inducible protein DinB